MSHIDPGATDAIHSAIAAITSGMQQMVGRVDSSEPETVEETVEETTDTSTSGTQGLSDEDADFTAEVYVEAFNLLNLGTSFASYNAETNEVTITDHHDGESQTLSWEDGMARMDFNISHRREEMLPALGLEDPLADSVQFSTAQMMYNKSEAFDALGDILEQNQNDMWSRVF